MNVTKVDVQLGCWPDDVANVGNGLDDVVMGSPILRSWLLVLVWVESYS